MATLATVALSCAKQLGRANSAGSAILDLGAEIKAEIAETVRYYSRQNFALTEFRGFELAATNGVTWYSAIDMTPGDGDQAARASVDVKDVLTIAYGRENDWPMERIDYRAFERLFEGTPSSGRPNYWTVYAGQIGLWPMPDDGYTVYFSGTIKPAVPALDADTSVWFDEAGELIEAGACRRVCLKYLRDRDRAMEFGALEDAARVNLAREYLLKSSSGKIKAHD